MGAIYIDDFNADSGWVKAGSWVDSTRSVSSGVMTMTPGAGAAGSSPWKKDGLNGWNISITVRAGASIAGIPQIHFRQSDASNYLVAYLDPSDATLNIGKVVAGVYTSLGSIASSITSGGTYTFTAKVFGNALFAAILTADGLNNVFKQLLYIGADVSAFTNTDGHGVGVTSSTQKYDWVDMRSLDSLTNVVCVGDSNVGVDNRLYWPNQMMKWRFNEGFIVTNEGQGGWSTQDVIDNYATRVDPFVIQGADNVLSIATGNNDFAVDSISPTTCHTRQLAVITHALSMGYNRFEIATLIPFPFADHGGYTSLEFVDQLNTLIRDGAATEGYTLCEIHNAFGATDGQLGVVPSSLVNVDQIHYSTTALTGGHALAARVHRQTIKKQDRSSIT